MTELLNTETLLAIFELGDNDQDFIDEIISTYISEAEESIGLIRNALQTMTLIIIAFQGLRTKLSLAQQIWELIYCIKCSNG